ncbi:MAG: N-acetylmuramoyl-L-alanine amidase [Ignavibacteria bacterium]|jgi:hypothetical protein
MAVEINKSLRLPDMEYFQTVTKKTGICIHHTVGGSALSTFNWWKEDPRHVGTAYIIGRDGVIYEVFDPKYWAFQFGLKSTDEWNDRERYAFEKRFIGIEIASEGGLIERNGKLYCFDKVSPKTEKSRDEAFDFGTDYRGYRYFDKYEPAQVDSLTGLINDLCEKFEIKKDVPKEFLKYYGKKLKDFQGSIGHTMVRADKTDPLPDINFWKTVVEKCDLSEVEVNSNQTIGENKMTEQQKKELFNNNVAELNKMSVAAGSMIKGLIMELKKPGRDTYIKLSNAVPDGHVISYELVEGEQTWVEKVGMALGLKSVTNNKLEVYGG